MARIENQKPTLSSQDQLALQNLREQITGEAKHNKILQDTQLQLSAIDKTPALAGKDSLFPSAKIHQWDNNPDFFKQKLKYQRENLPNNIHLVRDAELTFYRVQRGETISGIRQKLSKLSDFSYLSKAEYKQKMYGFNIRARALKAGMLLPIPIESSERRLTDEQFVNYCQSAIEEIKTDKKYGAEIESLLKKFSEKDLIELMLAVAKQESGGKPLGQFEFHRWENASHIQAFSFSIFHVVMRGSGFQARQNLGMTEGQTYHPKNAAKLFLAFLCEKSGNNSLEKYLPIGKQKTNSQFNKFASFYNGSSWKKFNPNYVKNLKKYISKAHNLLNSNPTQPLPKPSPEDEKRLALKKSTRRKPTSKQRTIRLTREQVTQKQKPNNQPKAQPKKIEKGDSKPVLFEIGESYLKQAILDANWLTNKETGINHLQSNRNAQAFVSRILKYLRDKYPKTGTTYYKNDRIGVSGDKFGSYLVFERNGKSAILRIAQNNTRSEKLARDPKFREVGSDNSIFRAILNSNSKNSNIYGQNILKTNTNALILGKRLESYLQKIYRQKVCFPTDKIAIWQDKNGPYLIFQRGNEKSAIIRP